MDYSTVLLAFGLTLFAGLSTGIGSAFAFFAKSTNTKFLTLSLGFSAGVMIYVSFVELFADGNASLLELFGETAGNWYTFFAFFGGIAVIALIDHLVPSFENPHEIRKIEDLQINGGDESVKLSKNIQEDIKKKKLMKMGVLTALAIAIHNFPEGMATFAASLKDVNLGLPIAIAIAIHNIPEGIAVSIPVFYATGSRKKAFWLSFLSGLAEPVGAIIGYLILMPFLNDATLGVIFIAIAGIMIFISLDELLPTAEEYGEHHLAIYGLIAGMAIMAISLNLF